MLLPLCAGKQNAPAENPGAVSRSQVNMQPVSAFAIHEMEHYALRRSAVPSGTSSHVKDFL